MDNISHTRNFFLIKWKKIIDISFLKRNLRRDSTPRWRRHYLFFSLPRKSTVLTSLKHLIHWLIYIFEYSDEVWIISDVIWRNYSDFQNCGFWEFYPWANHDVISTLSGENGVTNDRIQNAIKTLIQNVLHWNFTCIK